MKKCLIICWYGNLPDYFELWERSASHNANYEFLIFTDQEYRSKYANIHFIEKSIDEMNEYFSKKLGFQVNIKEAYKFCDFRPAFGIIFEEYLTKYDFWGHCDLDQILGDLDKYVTDKILVEYDKINFNGHYTLYKNTERINNLFKMDGSIFPFFEVFKSNENYAFDEYSGIKKIAEKNKIKTVYINEFCDIDVKYDVYNCVNSKNYKYQIYSWENGKVYKNYFLGKELVKEEKMYLHFQKKKPKLNINGNENRFIICKNGFIKFPKKITKEFIIDENGKMLWVTKNLKKIRYIIKKIKAFLKSNKIKKNIWIKQKIL